MTATARTFDDFTACGGVTAVFKPGSTALGHHRQLFGHNGSDSDRVRRIRPVLGTIKRNDKLVTVQGR